MELTPAPSLERMPPPLHAAPPAGLRPPLSTAGAQARERLLLTALKLFAERGFANTSTRDIAAAAGANIGAISYYFGDKLGLYRAAFQEPMGCGNPSAGPERWASVALDVALREFYDEMLAPLAMGDVARQCIRLHYREMTDPTGLWVEEIDTGIKPQHAALLQRVLHELGVREVDDDAHRLVFSIVAQGVFCFMAQDVIGAISPQILQSAHAIDDTAALFTRNAVAMVEADRNHRLNKTTRAGASLKQPT